MGHISNQWLNRGQGLRNRSYWPVPVAISSKQPRDSWSERNAVVLELTARKPDGKYQSLHLSQSEADEAAGTLVDSMSSAARDRLVVALLRELSNAKLLRALAMDLKSRVRLPKDR